MIKLKSLIFEVYDIHHSRPIMWTRETGQAIAEKINAKIVGSVAIKGFSKNDLDLRVNEYNDNIKSTLENMGFEYNGSQVVSPKEAKNSGKIYGSGWQRAEYFEDKNNRRIDVWHDEQEHKLSISENKESRQGRCYELSGRYVSRNYNSILVHGVIINPFDVGHKEIGHAWVEIGDKIFDPVMNKEWDKDAYEKLFKAKINNKYSNTDVLKISLKTRHWGPWESSELQPKKKGISELDEPNFESKVHGKTLISVDIQPEYLSGFGFSLESYLQFLNENFEDLDKLIFLYNGKDTVGDMDENSYKYWLLENGLDEEVADGSLFYDKGYAFFRYCIDSGIEYDSTVNFVRFMYQNNIADSRDMNREMWAKYLREHRHTDKKEVYNLLKKSGDCINIPDLMEYLKPLNNLVLTGGGIDECLAEVTIALEALNKPFELLHEYTY